MQRLQSTAKFIGCLLVIVCLLLPVLLKAQLNKADIDKLVNGLGDAFMKEKQAVGLSIGVYNNGTTSYYNFGTILRGTKTPPTQHTVYEIGSVTKVFVGLVLAHAVIENKVKLTDDIRLYLDGSYPNLAYNNVPITLEHLANTTSGIPNWLPETPSVIMNAPKDSTAFLRERVYGAFTDKDFYEALSRVKLDTVPGFKTRHSNAAAQLLTYILERVFKASIDELVKRYVTGPNGMSNTGFLTSLTNHATMAVGYDEEGRRMPYFSNQHMKGVGGLNATATDLMQFVKLQLASNDSAVALTQKTSFNAGYYGIGLNWLKYKHENGYQQLWADGGTYGFVSYLVFYPEINSGVVVLTNASDDAVPGKLGNIAYQIFEQIQKR